MYNHPLEKTTSFEDLLEIPAFLRENKEQPDDLEAKYAHPDDSDWQPIPVASSYVPIPNVYREI
jgi:hypothetical protein